MSIILVTPNSYDTIRDVIRCYRAQTSVKDIELVLANPNPETMDIVQSDLFDFHSWQLVKTPDAKNVGIFKACAVARASADIVVFGEDHSFPLANWAEALLERHSGPWAAVGPRVMNLNPVTPQSWAQVYMEYGPWMTSWGEGESELLPGHNSSFKKNYLLDFGERLADMLLSEYNLFIELRSMGHQLYFEPKAVTRHVNPESLFSLLRINFLSGRQFAAWRSKQFGFRQRLIFSFGAPLIPLVRFSRIFRMMREYKQPEPLSPAVLIYLGLNLAVDGVGQLLGYVLGLGNTTANIFPFEFHRTRFVKDKAFLEMICE